MINYNNLAEFWIKGHHQEVHNHAKKCDQCKDIVLELEESLQESKRPLVEAEQNEVTKITKNIINFLGELENRGELNFDEQQSEEYSPKNLGKQVTKLIKNYRKTQKCLSTRDSLPAINKFEECEEIIEQNKNIGHEALDVSPESPCLPEEKEKPIAQEESQNDSLTGGSLPKLTELAAKKSVREEIIIDQAKPEESHETGNETSDVFPESPCLPEEKEKPIEPEVGQEILHGNSLPKLARLSESLEDFHPNPSCFSEEMEVKKESAYSGWKYDVTESDGIEEDQLFYIEEENYLAGKSDRREVIHTSEEKSISFIFVCYFCEKENPAKVLQEEQEKIEDLAGKNKKIELERECIICKRRNKFELPIFGIKIKNDINKKNMVIKVNGVEPNKS